MAWAAKSCATWHKENHMSRIAKYPVSVPSGVEPTIGADQITVKGPLGTMTQALTGDVKVELDNGQLTFAAVGDTKHAHAMSGTVRALVKHMLVGVRKGVAHRPTLGGVGFPAQGQGRTP